MNCFAMDGKHFPHLGGVQHPKKYMILRACQNFARSIGTNRDLGSESMGIVGILAARIVGGAAVATVAVGVVFVALMLVESLSQSPDEIAKERRPVN